MNTGSQYQRAKITALRNAESDDSYFGSSEMQQHLLGVRKEIATAPGNHTGGKTKAMQFIE